jgi:hypothetical protein
MHIYFKIKKSYLYWMLLSLPVFFSNFKTAGDSEDNMKVSSTKRPFTNIANNFYIGNRAPLKPLCFMKLPIGSIQPKGWIKKYLELQRDGLPGQLGEISTWLDKSDNAWYSDNSTGKRGWEEVPYWLKGYGDLGYELKDKKIITETKLWLDKVFQSQRQDGSFGPMAVEKGYLNNNQGNNPDLWPNMIMLWCMQSYYDYSNDPKVISLMTKYFKWQATIPENKLLKLYWENSRGGDDLYSIYWLYNRTGEDWLLDLAKKIHQNTANWGQKDNLPNWHNVNIAQGFREPATYYMQSKDSSNLMATYNDFNLIRNLYGQVPGGMFGADEDARKGYDDPRQAIETCGIVEEMASDEMLLGITGDPFWGDHCENVTFNTFPAAVMPDFKALRYLTAPNMVVSDSKDHAPGIENGGPDLMMNPFISRCCQHNHGQGWPYYAEHLWMATPDNGLSAMLYNSCSVTAQVGSGKTITLNEETHYPFDDKIKIEVIASGAVKFPLYLRIPSWCNNGKIYINGKSVDHYNTAASYTIIERTWNNKDIINIEFPMQLTLKEWVKNKKSVSVNYGPLTFSLKIKEDYERRDSKSVVTGPPKWQENVDANKWPSFEIFAASKWNYGLLLNKCGILKEFEIVKKIWPGDDFPFTQENVPIEIKAKGKLIPTWKVDQYGLCGLLPQSPVKVNTNTDDIILIPMGAARLRISSFPVIKN